MKNLVVAGLILTGVFSSSISAQQQCKSAFADKSENHYVTNAVPMFNKGSKTVFAKISYIQGRHYLILETFVQPQELYPNQISYEGENYLTFHEGEGILRTMEADHMERDESLLRLYYILDREDLMYLGLRRFRSFSLKSAGVNRNYKDIKRYNKNLFNTYVECSLLM